MAGDEGSTPLLVLSKMARIVSSSEGVLISTSFNKEERKDGAPPGPNEGGDCAELPFCCVVVAVSVACAAELDEDASF